MNLKLHDPFSTLSGYQIQFLRSLSRNRVQCLVIGGYAMRFHGCDRSAEDLDLLVGYDPENGHRLLAVLKEVGGVNLDTAQKVLTKPKFKVRWRDVEMLTSIDGLNFDTAVSRAATAAVEDLTVLVVSKDDLLTSKNIALRNKDQDDIVFLRRETLPI